VLILPDRAENANWQFLTVGGPCAVVAANVPSKGYTNTSLDNGTLYYYSDSATNSTDESANSRQVGARPVATTPPTMTLAKGSGQMTLRWPTDHTGWLLLEQTNTPGVGLGTNWGTVRGSDTNNQIMIPIVASNSSVFFRLASPWPDLATCNRACGLNVGLMLTTIECQHDDKVVLDSQSVPASLCSRKP